MGIGSVPGVRKVSLHIESLATSCFLETLGSAANFWIRAAWFGRVCSWREPMMSFFEA